MSEKEFAYQLFQILNRTRQLEVATLTIEPFQNPPILYIQLCNGEKFSIHIQTINKIL